MKIILTLLSFSIAIITSAKCATANCINGECEFTFSNHYKYAKTHCLQTMNFEQVETEYLSFKILKDGQVCKIIESKNED
tara:strand:- start:86 stop:325 length:240 start_codon:yes stop_codon:yes gene_type:complete